MAATWPLTFAQSSDLAARYFRSWQYLDAAIEWRRAATLAPTPWVQHVCLTQETVALERLWMAREHASGRRSELEPR